MFISLNTNLSMIKSANALEGFNKGYFNSVKDLSSGIRINSASDDAANLSLSKKLDKTSSGLEKGSENIGVGLSKIQTYDGYLSNLSDLLHKMRDIGVQSATGTYSPRERQQLNQVLQSYRREFDTIIQKGNNEIGAVLEEDIEFVDPTVTQKTYQEAVDAGYNDAHIITDASEFVSKISADLNGNFILTDDIDMSELGTFSDSAITGTFTGELDGNAHKIKNFTLNYTGGATNHSVGVFARLNGATIKDLGIENLSVTSNFGVNTNDAGTGGLTGSAASSVIERTYVKGSITARGRAGLITGTSYTSTIIRDSYSEGSVSASTNPNNGTAGGLVGLNQDSSTQILRSYSTADVSGGKLLGGLVGYNFDGADINQSYATGNVTGTGDEIGGLVGRNYYHSPEINNSYATGNVSGNAEVGGLVGHHSVAINNNDNNFATGSVSGNSDVGGLVGFNSYGTSYYPGGFWDTDKSGTTNSAGGTGLTSAQIAANAGPIGSFNTSIWDLSGDTPTLKNVDPPNFDTYVAASRNLGDMDIQVGENADSASRYSISDIAINYHGLDDISCVTPEYSRQSIESIDQAINYVSEKRASVGSVMTSLENIKKKNNSRNNQITHSNSTIKDTDMAYEAAKMTKNQILSQAATSIFQQAQNISQSSVLSLYSF